MTGKDSVDAHEENEAEEVKKARWRGNEAQIAIVRPSPVIPEEI